MALHNALVLFDMSNFIHRSFHSLPVEKFRRSSDNLATNALYGTTKIMLSILEDFSKKYHHVHPVACFDTAKSKLARMNIDPNYKAQRPSAPNELKHQFAWVRELVAAMNINQLELESHEADDIIASLAFQNKDKFEHVIIVSTDKDFNQCLIQDNMLLYNLSKKEFLNRQSINDKYGVVPEYFTLYQALIGDKIDNVPGVKGIGPKVAPLIVNQARGDIKTLIQQAQESSVIKNKSKVILDNLAELENSYALVSLPKDLELPNHFDQFELKSLKVNKQFASILTTMSFTSFKKKYC